MFGYCNDCDMYDKTKECPNWNRCFRAFNTGVANIVFTPKGLITDFEETALFVKHLSFTNDETGQIVVKDRFKSDEFAEDYKTYSDIMFTALTELTNANLFGNYKIIIMEEK